MENKREKDPRQTLYVFFRISLLTLIFTPFIYHKIKEGNIKYILLLFIIYLIIFFILKKSFKGEEYNLHNVTMIGYMFSGVWLFVALCILFVVSLDYFQQQLLPEFRSILAIIVLLPVSLILFYLARKSKKYEKSHE